MELVYIIQNLETISSNYQPIPETEITRKNTSQNINSISISLEKTARAGPVWQW